MPDRKAAPSLTKAQREALEQIIRNAPALRARFAEIKKVREQLGLKPGEPLLGLFEEESP